MDKMIEILQKKEEILALIITNKKKDSKSQVLEKKELNKRLANIATMETKLAEIFLEKNALKGKQEIANYLSQALPELPLA